MTYTGDGDSKAYFTVVKIQPYGPNKISTKVECIGHVQKREDANLRKSKIEHGKEILSHSRKQG